MLHIRLFGSGHATLYDQPLTGFPYQQAYLLLCHLLLNRSRPHNRERLAAVFWGDYSTDASRKNLRNVLWRLRHAFQSLGAIADEYVWINEESASFSATSRYCLDVEAFETTVTRCRDVSGQDLTPEQATALEQAVELYTGDLLEGIYERIAGNFSDHSPICKETAIAMLSAAALSFLGLGAQPPTPEWGAMISTGRNYLPDRWWYATFPGGAIFLTVLGWNLLGDGLRDVLDPRSRL